MRDIQIKGISYSYMPNVVHRNRTPNKSQWTIPEASEMLTFQASMTHEWSDGRSAWGLFIPNAQPEYLGVDRDHITRVFLARFEAQTLPKVWHGYPISYRDIPPPEKVINSWLMQAILTPAKLSKIVKRKKCSL
jgi:hypothetical protein